MCTQQRLNMNSSGLDKKQKKVLISVQLLSLPIASNSTRSSDDNHFWPLRFHQFKNRLVILIHFWWIFCYENADSELSLLQHAMKILSQVINTGKYQQNYRKFWICVQREREIDKYDETDFDCEQVVCAIMRVLMCVCVQRIYKYIVSSLCYWTNSLRYERSESICKYGSGTAAQ